MEDGVGVDVARVFCEHLGGVGNHQGHDVDNRTHLVGRNGGLYSLRGLMFKASRLPRTKILVFPKDRWACSPLTNPPAPPGKPSTLRESVVKERCLDSSVRPAPKAPSCIHACTVYPSGYSGFAARCHQDSDPGFFYLAKPKSFFQTTHPP